MKFKIFLALLLLICLVMALGDACADFYVVAAGKRAKRTVLVSPRNAAQNHSDNGADLLAAFSKITDASADNPYLVIIEPGVYNIGSTALQMKSYVDVQGSGENVTKITGTVDGEFSGVVIGADHMEIRFLTVENTGGGTYSNGIYNQDCTISMKQVTALASGGEKNNGIYNHTDVYSTMIHVTAKAAHGAKINRGIFNKDSTDIMTDVTAKGTGGEHCYGILCSSAIQTMTNVSAEAIFGDISSRGVSCWESSVSMNNVKAEAASTVTGTSYGIFNYGASTRIVNSEIKASNGTDNYGVYSGTVSTVHIDHSRIIGKTRTVHTLDGSTTRIGNTLLEGGFITNEGTCICAGVYDENYTFYPSTCP